MGYYYGVKCIKDAGKRITSFDYENNLLDHNENVVAVMNNGLYSIAPDVTDKSEYKEFYSSYSKGFWLRMDLYSVNEDILKACPDEGRLYEGRDDF